MKTENVFVFIVMFILFSACMSKGKDVETGNWIIANESKLSSDDREIAKQIKEYLFKEKEVITRSKVEAPAHWLTGEEVEGLTLVMQPYYELDTSFISTDLDENEIESYIKPMRDKRLFFGKRGEKYILMVIAEKNGDTWKPKLRIEDSKVCFQELFDWLLPALEVSSKKSFYVLSAMYRDYFVYHDSEGKLVFRNMPGNIKMNSRDFIYSMVHSYNNVKAARAYLEKNKCY